MAKPDALDKLREWIRKNGYPYSKLGTHIIIHGGIVTDVLIQRGDEEIRIRADDKIKIPEPNTNSHF